MSVTIDLTPYQIMETLSPKECKALYQFFELLECKYALELQNL